MLTVNPSSLILKNFIITNVGIISTSLIFSAWNALTYVGQINNEYVMEAEKNNQHVQHVQEIIKKYGTLWFNDELLVIEHQE